MKTLLLLACLCTAGGGDREQGLEHYREGRYGEAVAAFRRAIEHDGDAADLQWNLALASWRAGDLAAAETAAEKYAALAEDARVDLHRGLLGAVRFAEAQALETEADALQAGGAAPPSAAPVPADAPPDPLPVLEQALAKATQAKNHFVAGAAAHATPELLRNMERALRYTEELQKKIDERKQQREQQQQDGEQPDDQKPDDQKPKDDGEKQADDPQEKQEPQPGEPDQKQDGEQGDPNEGEPGEPQPPPEPKPDAGAPGEDDASQQTEPKSDQPQPASPAEDEAQQPRTDAPGEVVEGKELTREQAQRLLEQLKQLDAKLQALRQGSKTGRRPVGRDW